MPKPTEAQQKALDVLQAKGSALVSNQTVPELGYIYWQTARWLINSGYAKHDGWENEQEKLLITNEGRKAK